MGEYKGFVRLNREQRSVLRLVKPFDGDEEFLAKLERGEIDGMSYTRIVPTLGELEQIGYLSIVKDEDGRFVSLALGSICFCYWQEYLVNICLPAAVRGLAGVSGGLVVYLLARFLG